MNRVSVVLGAGGPIGHAYHAGALSALQEELGWDAREATLLLGTSAGAQVSALLRAGMEPADLRERVRGGRLTRRGETIAQHFTRPDYVHDSDAPYAPSSPAYLRAALRRPWTARPGRLVSALLPTGSVCLRGQAAGLRALFGEDWPDAGLWITAVCLGTGEAHAFGREDTPRTDVGTAVACSGAVPGVCEPVQVGSRRFVDGGVASPTHCELLEETAGDLVIVSSPLSLYPPMRWLLRRELRRLEERGHRVWAFEPDRALRAAMGLNPMDRARAPAVALAAAAAMRRRLADPAVRRTLEAAGA